jgi:hypothetical protein
MLGKAREAGLLHEAQNGIGDIFECFDRQFGINWQGERLGSGGGRVRAISRAVADAQSIPASAET